VGNSGWARPSKQQLVVFALIVPLGLVKNVVLGKAKNSSRPKSTTTRENHQQAVKDALLSF